MQLTLNLGHWLQNSNNGHGIARLWTKSLLWPVQLRTRGRETGGHHSKSFGVITMKKLSILVPAAIAGVLVSAMVLAAPQAPAGKVASVSTLDRAAAYKVATAD